jgi:hypothetical protein
MILSAAYLLWMFQRLMFGNLSDFLRGIGHHLRDMDPIEILTLAPLAALVVVFGLFPALILDLVGGSVTSVLGDVRAVGPVALPPVVPLAGLAIVAAILIARLVVAAAPRPVVAPGAVVVQPGSGSGGAR